MQVSLDAYDNLRNKDNDSNISFGPDLFAGPSGIGKIMTTVLLCSALGNYKLIETNGQTLKYKAELYAVLVQALKQMGLPENPKQVKTAMTALYPDGPDGHQDSGKVILDVCWFLCPKR